MSNGHNDMISAMQRQIDQFGSKLQDVQTLAIRDINELAERIEELEQLHATARIQTGEQEAHQRIPSAGFDPRSPDEVKRDVVMREFADEVAKQVGSLEAQDEQVDRRSNTEPKNTGGKIRDTDAGCDSDSVDAKLEGLLMDITSAFIESDGLYWQTWVDKIKEICGYEPPNSANEDDTVNTTETVVSSGSTEVESVSVDAIIEQMNKAIVDNYIVRDNAINANVSYLLNTVLCPHIEKLVERAEKAEAELDALHTSYDAVCNENAKIMKDNDAIMQDTMTPDFKHIEERLENYDAYDAPLLARDVRNLIAYVRELEKDKARLDWLGAQHCMSLYARGGTWDIQHDSGRYGWTYGETFRQAIDNAKE